VATCDQPTPEADSLVPHQPRRKTYCHKRYGPDSEADSQPLQGRQRRSDHGHGFGNELACLSGAAAQQGFPFVGAAPFFLHVLASRCSLHNLLRAEGDQARPGDLGGEFERTR